MVNVNVVEISSRISWCCDSSVYKMILRLRYLSLLCAIKMNYIGVCGKDSIIGPRIINGTVAKTDVIKYQVSIHLKERDWYFGSGHICGGSLIKPSIVVTAAHCIYNYDFNVIRTPNEFTISMGSTDRFDRINSSAFEVLDIYYKETFNITTFADDIAIFILNGFIPEYYKNIKPIEVNWDDIPDDTICQVSGWGVTEEGGTSDILMTLNVPIVNQAVCEKNYNGSILEGMMCAGYMNGSADACDGDSGGPLVCNGKLTGIISFGVGCAIQDFPGVYTDLKYHYKWIKKITNRFERLKSSAINIVPSSLFIILFLVLIPLGNFYFS